MRPAVRRTLLVLLLVFIAAAIWFVVEGGRYLQHEDPLRKADAIFVLAGSKFERPLEAVDLYRAQYAPVILLSVGSAEVSETRLRAQGIRLPSDLDTLIDVLTQLGVPRSALLTPNGQVFDNTAQEASFLRRTAAARGWHTVIVVTAKYHTRRAGFAMRRALEGSGISIIMRATRYDPSDPAHWSRRRFDFRWVTAEWQKLLAYRLGLAD